MKIWKKLIIPAVLFAVLLAVLIIVKLLPQGNGAESSTSETSVEGGGYILEILSTDTEKLTILAEDGSSFSLTTNGYAADGAALWTYQNSKNDTTGYNFSMEKLNTFVNVFQEPDKTSKVVDNASDLSEYGLDTPSFIVQYKMKDGSSHELKLGDLTFEDRYVYCMIDNDPAVYTTYKIIRTKCETEPIEFLDTMVTQLESDDVVSATFYRKSDDLTILAEQKLLRGMNAEKDELGWYINEPFSITASPAFKSLIDPMLNLKVTSFVEKDTTNFMQYGLTDPEYRFSFTLKNGQKRRSCFQRIWVVCITEFIRIQRMSFRSIRTRSQDYKLRH